MLKLCWIFISLVIIGFCSCQGSSKEVIYNDATFANLNKEKNIIIQFTDGREARFYKIQIAKIDDDYIYARCWEKKNDISKDYKFPKNQVVIKSVQFRTSNTVGYVLSVAILFGVLYLLQKAIYD